MSKPIRFNAFEMNCVGHQSPGLWAHPRDRSWQYKDLDYWTDLARVLERGIFDAIFIADVIFCVDLTLVIRPRRSFRLGIAAP